MKNINIIKLFLCFTLLLGFTSCDEGGDPDPGATNVVEMSGDWYVKLLVDGEDVYNIGYYLLSTYNTAADNGNEIWIDDHGLWPLKAKSPVSINSKTFSGTNLESSVDGYDITATITNGTVVENGATTSGGNTSDLISFNIEFSDDPGTIYTIEGYQRTGFLEDEH